MTLTMIIIQEDPNFHKYLQSEVLGTASDAVLGEPGNAAQFQITGGQLIQNASGGKLYAVVEPRANSTVMKLKVSWSTTPATNGTFVFSGDTVEWSNPSITRPQNNVSPSFISLGCSNSWEDVYESLCSAHRPGLFALMQQDIRTYTSISVLTLTKLPLVVPMKRFMGTPELLPPRRHVIC